MIHGFFKKGFMGQKEMIDKFYVSSMTVKAFSALVLLAISNASAGLQSDNIQRAVSKEYAQAQTSPRVHNVDVESFKCAQELLPSIDILGRGTDYPNFLIKDIHTELLRQDDDTEILEIKCSGEPKIEGMFAELEMEGETQTALDQLSVKFPVEMLVDTGTTVWIMHVEHNYRVSSLAKGSPKLVQTFDVIETLNEDGSELKGKEIQIIRRSESPSPLKPENLE